MKKWPKRAKWGPVSYVWKDGTINLRKGFDIIKEYVEVWFDEEEKALVIVPTDDVGERKVWTAHGNKLVRVPKALLASLWGKEYWGPVEASLEERDVNGRRVPCVVVRKRPGGGGA